MTKKMYTFVGDLFHTPFTHKDIDAVIYVMWGVYRDRNDLNIMNISMRGNTAIFGCDVPKITVNLFCNFISEYALGFKVEYDGRYNCIDVRF